MNNTTKDLHARILEIMRAHQIEYIEAHYDGCGDSGSVDNVDSLPEMDLTKIDYGIHQYESPVYRYDESGKNLREVKERRLDLRETVEELTYTLLNARHGGWEINEGSNGDFTFYASGRITNSHTENVPETTEEDVEL